MARISWLDEEKQTPAIDRRARELDSFVDAFADGQVDDAELKAQEDKLTALMRRIEPKLDDALHAEVTELLCELTAYDIMQCFHALQSARPASAFQG